MRVLVGTDLSPRSQVAVARALQLRRQPEDGVALVHVVDGDQPDEIVSAQRERAMEWIVDHVPGGSNGSVANLFVRTGDPHAELMAAADEYGADLIVLGTHRRRLLLDAFIGTTAERLIRVSTRPVLVVHHPELRPYRSALAATDLSDTSIQALLVARQLNLLPVQSRILHVFRTPAKGKLQQAGVDPAAHIAAMRTEAAEALARRLRQAGLRSLEGRVQLREGRATDTIRQFVGEIEPDLLVLGTRGLGGLKRAALGSVTEALLRTVPCDVLAVPPPPPGALRV